MSSQGENEPDDTESESILDGVSAPAEPESMLPVEEQSMVPFSANLDYFTERSVELLVASTRALAFSGAPEPDFNISSNWEDQGRNMLVVRDNSSSEAMVQVPVSHPEETSSQALVIMEPRALVAVGEAIDSTSQALVPVEPQAPVDSSLVVFEPPMTNEEYAVVAVEPAVMVAVEPSPVDTTSQDDDPVDVPEAPAQPVPRVDHQEMYQDDVSLRTSDIFEVNAKPDAYNDDQTIATAASQHPMKPKAGPETIYEEEEEVEEEAEEEELDIEEQFLPEPSGTGLTQRPRGDTRKAFSREVEVSMDGFLHQVQPKMQGVISEPYGDYFVGGPVDEEKVIPKMSKLLQMVTAICVLGLVATASFFAVHIGPFVVQPTLMATTTTTSEKEVVPDDVTTASSHMAVGGLEKDSFGTNSSATSQVEKVFLNWTIPYMGSNSELPLIWTYPMSGADIVQEIFGRCLGKVQAGNGMEFDSDGAHAAAWNAEVSSVWLVFCFACGLANVLCGCSQYQSLQVVSLQGHLYANVNLYTTEGIDRAARLGFASSRVADIAYSPLLTRITSIFEPQEGRTTSDVLGRLLVVFRDPIERALNRYEQTRLLTGNDQLTLTQYAKDPAYAENNPLTRGILGIGPDDRLEHNDIRKAQEIIRVKVLIGIFAALDVTLERYERFFSWYAGDISPQIQTCHQETWKSFSSGYSVNSRYNEADPIGFNLIVAQHRMDALLYGYVLAQFEYQGLALEASPAQLTGGSSTKN